MVTTPGLSHRAYGRHRKELGLPGGNAVAVGRAIATERLKDALVWDGGKSFVRDAAEADAEWAAKTDLSRAPSTVKEAAVTGGDVTAKAVTTRSRTPRGSTLTDAATREKNAKADLAELEYLRKAGELVSARDVEQAWAEMVAQMRAAVLSVPSKAKQRLPHLSQADLAQLSELLSHTLEGLTPPPAPAVHGAAA